MRAAKGPTLGWDAATAASLAKVGPEDVASAKALWRRCAGKRLGKLLDAKAKR